MCGINGIYNFSGDPINKNSIQIMNSMLEHRGPDDSGIFFNDNIALGHRRLSIIDVKNGKQPMSNDDDTLHISYNGEVYNHLEIREELEKYGYKFRTNSDTEVVLKCYEKFGLSFVDKLRGMFAIGIWDARLNQIVLVRDRLGQKPIYYFKNDNSFIFSSELKAIVKSLKSTPEINSVGLSEYLKYGFVPSPKTIYKNIHKLPAAHILTFSNNNITINKYWYFSSNKKRNELSKLGFNEIKDKLKNLLSDSVKIRLMSEVPLGAFLSGGLDSSGIVALMANHSEAKVNTFSIGLKDNENSELKYARILSNHFGTNHHEYMIDLDDFTMLPKIIDMFGEPFADPAAAYNYQVSKLAKKDVTVALSGDGGDEIFAGYPWYVSLIKQGYFKNTQNYSKYVSLLYSIWPNNFRGKSKLDLLRQPNNVSIYLLMKNRFPNHFRDQLFHKDFLYFLSSGNNSEYMIDINFQNHHEELLSLMQGVDMESYLPDDINVKVDRMSMQNSLEVRSPILDHKIVEFAYNLPNDMKIKDGHNQKFILKEVFKSLLPKEIIKRSKQGFGLPSKLSNESDIDRLYNFSKEILLDKTSIKRKIFNQDKIEKLLSNHRNKLSDPTLSFNQIWNLICLELWFQSAKIDLKL